MSGLPWLSPWLLWASALSAAPQVVKLSERLAQVERGRVEAARLARDGRHGVYSAVVGTGVEKLYAFDLEAAQLPVDLGLEPARRDGMGVEITPDGSLVVCVVKASRTQIGLSSTRVGEAPRRLDDVRIAEGDVTGFALSLDGAWVLFRADAAVDERFELFLVPSDGSQPARRVSGPLQGTSSVAEDFAFDPTSSWFAYRADQERPGVVELFAADLAGRTAKLNGAVIPRGDVHSFQISPDGRALAYLADQERDGLDELHGVLLGPVPLLAKLNGPLVNGGGVVWFQFSPDGRRIVYRARQDSEAIELYSVDAARHRRKLNAPLVSGGSVHASAFVPGRRELVYTADQEVDGRDELYVVDTEGVRPAVKLNPPLPADADVRSELVLSPDGRWLMFVVRQSQTNSILYRVAVDASVAPALVTEGVLVESIRVSPDNRWVFALWGDGRGLIRYALDGSAPLHRGETIESIEWMAGTPGLEPFLLARQRDVDAMTDVHLWRITLAELETRERVSYFRPFLTVGKIDDFFTDASGSQAFYLATQDSATRPDLLAVPVDGSRLPVWVNDAAVPNGVRAASLSPDGAWVAMFTSLDPFLAALGSLVLARSDGSGSRTTIPGHVSNMQWSQGGSFLFTRLDPTTTLPHPWQLYAVPADGSQPPRRLNGPLPRGGSVVDEQRAREPGFDVTPDGRTVVYLADQDTDQQVELYRVPTDGTAPSIRLNAPLGQFEDVQRFRISPDSRWVAYLSEDASTSRISLQATHLARPGSAVRLADGEAEFEFSQAGDELLFLLEADEALYRVPVDGSRAPERLSAVGEAVVDFEAVAGPHAVYQAVLAESMEVHLVSQSLGSPATPRRLSPVGGAGPGQDTRIFLCSPDRTAVAFSAKGRLLFAPVDGSVPTLELDDTLPPNRVLRSEAMQFSSDGTRLAYQIPDPAAKFQVFVALTDGSAEPKRANGPLAEHANLIPNGSQRTFLLTSDGGRLLYLADQLQNGLFELYSSSVEFGPRKRTR